MSALGIANGILDIKEGDKVLGWTEIIISVIFLLLSLRTINEYDPIIPNKRGGMRIAPSRPDGSPFTTGEIILVSCLTMLKMLIEIMRLTGGVGLIRDKHQGLALVEVGVTLMKLFLHMILK